MTFGCDICLGLLVVIFVCDFWLELGIGMVVVGEGFGLGCDFCCDVC